MAGCCASPWTCPTSAHLAVEVEKPGATLVGNVPVLGNFLREVMRLNMQNFRRVRAGRDAVQPAAGAVYEVTKKAWLGEYFPEDADGGNLAPDGRVMEMLSEHTVEGWLEGYILSGRHGLLNSYESFIHVIDSMVNQHAKWLEKCNELPWRAEGLLAQPADHRAGLAAGPQRVHAPGPRLPRRGGQQEPERGAHLPAARCQLPAVGRRPLPAQHQLHQRHRRGQAGASAIPRHGRGDRPLHEGRWASGTGRATTQGAEPDVVMASCGDVPTMESLAATALLRQHLPDVKVRFVNVVDLFKLVPNTEHPHGLTDREFEALFTADKPVVFNFHAYPWLIHRLTYRRPGQHNIHVRGYKEQGNINTPLELAIRNQTDRFSLAIDAIDRMPRFRATGVERSRGAAQPADRVPEPRVRVRHRPAGHHRLAVAVLKGFHDDP